MICPICSQAIFPKLTSWTYYCGRCDYWGSTLRPVTKVLPKDEFLAQRETQENPIEYLDDLRRQNFRICLQHLAVLKDEVSGPLLEVGCGAGLFLECANAAGFDARGIEAYEAMARQGIKLGRNIRIGLFPDCLDEKDRFGAVVFNDVFEHLPDVAQLLRTCRRHLPANGLLVINHPNSHGLFFRIATGGHRVGFRGPWERLWQKMFFTPHLHYFSPKSLELLCRAAGFEPVTATIGLKAVSLKGLWSRIKADPDASAFQGMLTFASTILLASIAPLFESDCILRIFRKTP